MPTREQCLDVPGSPYWCGVKDRKDGLKSNPHYYPSLPAGSMKRWAKDKMMDMEVDQYLLGYAEGAV